MHCLPAICASTGNAIPSSIPQPSSSSAPVSESTMSGVYNFPSAPEPHPHPTVSHSGTGMNPTTTANDVIYSTPQPPAPLLQPKYNAKSAMFENIVDIPQDLLGAVALCFQHHRIVCRMCFFNSSCRILTSKGAAKSGACEEGHQWRPLIIMPACRLCINFNSNPYVPVLPIPKHMKSATSPFVICKKGDHKTCYYMSKTTNPWFPHTVEELVIWTVERERCTLPHERHADCTCGVYMYSVVSMNKWRTTTPYTHVDVEQLPNECTCMCSPHAYPFVQHMVNWRTVNVTAK